VTDTSRIDVVGAGENVLVRIERELIQVLTVIASRLPQVNPDPELEHGSHNREENDDNKDDCPTRDPARGRRNFRGHRTIKY
jgi:hypothetical protein